MTFCTTVSTDLNLTFSHLQLINDQLFKLNSAKTCISLHRINANIIIINIYLCSITNCLKFHHLQNDSTYFKKGLKLKAASWGNGAIPYQYRYPCDPAIN